MWMHHLHRCLQRLGALGLLALLALGPFLHAHWAQASLGGFHMDGVSLHQHASATDAPMLSADDEHESAAIGVASSLPRGAEKTPSASDLDLWVGTLLLLAVLARITPLSLRTHTPRLRLRRMTRGTWPPLALAPPHA